MNSQKVISLASKHLQGLSGHKFDVLEVAKPASPAAAVNLAKIVSKLSPMVGNLIEFNTCEFLNDLKVFQKYGCRKRQDPGFPDTIFLGKVRPTPGFEIKAWFPLATEITARFKDSQNHFSEDQTYVAVLAWLPEFLISGKPKILGIVVVSGISVAQARDLHYHNPPDYLVLEPEDTAKRTSNLQQTNTNGYKFQGTSHQLKKAKAIVARWGPRGRHYLPNPKYQAKLRQLIGRFPYRLDTNFAKMDRIVHPEIEAFKRRIYEAKVHDHTIAEWKQILCSQNNEIIRNALKRNLGIKYTGRAVVR